MVTLSQEFSFTRLIGQGCTPVTVWYDYDEDTNTINEMVVSTEDGYEIDQYLNGDTLSLLEVNCYLDQKNRIVKTARDHFFNGGDEA
jgi:hypothetical protein